MGLEMLVFRKILRTYLKDGSIFQINSFEITAAVNVNLKISLQRKVVWPIDMSRKVLMT